MSGVDVQKPLLNDVNEEQQKIDAKSERRALCFSVLTLALSIPALIGA